MNNRDRLAALRDAPLPDVVVEAAQASVEKHALTLSDGTEVSHAAAFSPWSARVVAAPGLKRLGMGPKVAGVRATGALVDHADVQVAKLAKKTLEEIPGRVRRHARSLFAKSSTLVDNTGHINSSVASIKVIAETKAGIDLKVGLIGARSRLGQAAQAAVSVALPGDLSDVRRPVRSTVYETLTPGGGDDDDMNLPGGRDDAYRCPVGFQYGGRFTDSRFSTCGMQLFDFPDFLGLTIGQMLGSGPGLVGLIRREGESIGGGGLPGDGADVAGRPRVGGADDMASRARRMASVPEVSAANDKQRDAMIRRVVRSISGSNDSQSAVIRRDGMVLRPLLPSGSLRKFSDNPDLQGATLVRSLRSPNIDKDDIGLLAGTGVREVIFQVPGGTLNLSVQRELTVGEKRSFGRMLNAAAENADPYDPEKALVEFAGKTNGAIRYEQRIADKKKNALIEVEIGGVKRRIRRWAYEAFYKGRGGGESNTDGGK